MRYGRLVFAVLAAAMMLSACASLPVLFGHGKPGGTAPPPSTVQSESSSAPAAGNTDTAPSTSEPIAIEQGFTVSELDETVRQRIVGVSYPPGGAEEISLDELRHISVLYIDFEGETRSGELIVNTLIADCIAEIFRRLYEEEYPIHSIKLVDEYGGDDELSMSDNNTSCFNYRSVPGGDKLSLHSLGLAVDINPLYNPYVTANRVLPEEGAQYADRSADFPGKIDKDDLCYKLFTEFGFSWGGDWKNTKDYQHFFLPE